MPGCAWHGLARRRRAKRSGARQGTGRAQATARAILHMTTQLDLIPPAPPIPEIADNDPNVELLVRLLTGRDWRTSAELLAEMEQPVHESKKRWLRALATASKGRVGSGQRGYKLVMEMTRGEFDHNRNWMLRQCEEMKRRVVEMDCVFYTRQPVPPEELNSEIRHGGDNPRL